MKKKSQPAGVPTHVQLRKLFLVVNALVTSAACHWFMHTSLLHGDLADSFNRCTKTNQKYSIDITPTSCSTVLLVLGKVVWTKNCGMQVYGKKLRENCVSVS